VYSEDIVGEICVYCDLSLAGHRHWAMVIEQDFATIGESRRKLNSPRRRISRTINVRLRVMRNRLCIYRLEGHSEGRPALPIKADVDCVHINLKYLPFTWIPLPVCRKNYQVRMSIHQRTLLLSVPVSNPFPRLYRSNRIRVTYAYARSFLSYER
jgi:hypothetical protein